MASDRYSRTFDELARKGEGAFVPFTVLGDPDPETSLAILDTFVEGGADMLELGIPFSDPVADGPTIQQADARALAAQVTPTVALGIVEKFRTRHPGVPVGLLLYANLVCAPGLTQFYARAARAGVDSVLIADVPLEESVPFRRAARSAGVGSVSLVAPTSSDQRLAAIVKAGGPYLYVVSRVGVTGQDRQFATSAASLLDRLKSFGTIPTLLGFGISDPDHVRAAILAGASGAISGSAIVSIVNRHIGDRPLPLAGNDRRQMLEEIRSFVGRMKQATLPSFEATNAGFAAVPRPMV